MEGAQSAEVQSEAPKDEESKPKFPVTKVPKQRASYNISAEQRKIGCEWYTKNIENGSLPSYKIPYPCSIGDIKMMRNAIEVMITEIGYFRRHNMAKVFLESLNELDGRATMTVLCLLYQVKEYFTQILISPFSLGDPSSGETLCSLLHYDPYLRSTLAKLGYQLIRTAEIVCYARNFRIHLEEKSWRSVEAPVGLRRMMENILEAGCTVLGSAALKYTLVEVKNKLNDLCLNLYGFYQNIFGPTEPNFPKYHLRKIDGHEMPYYSAGHTDALTGMIFNSYLKAFRGLMNKLEFWAAQASLMMKSAYLISGHAFLVCLGLRILAIVDERFIHAVRDFHKLRVHPDSKNFYKNPDYFYSYDKASREEMDKRYEENTELLKEIIMELCNFIGRLTPLTEFPGQYFDNPLHISELDAVKMKTVNQHQIYALRWIRRLCGSLVSLLTSVEKTDEQINNLILEVMWKVSDHARQPVHRPSDLVVVDMNKNDFYINFHNLDNALFSSLQLNCL